MSAAVVQPHSGRRTLTVLLAFMVLSQAAYIVGLLLPFGATFLVDVVLCLLAQWSTVAVFVAVATQSRFRRLYVVLATLAVIFSATGETIYAISADSDGYLPSPSVADIAYLLFYPLLVAAIVVIVRTRLRQRVRAIAVLDGIVAALGSAALLALILTPVLENVAATGYSLEAWITASYPSLDLLLVAVLGGLAASPNVDLGPRWIALITGLLVFATADGVYTVLEQQGLYTAGAPLDALWTLGLGLLGWWAAGQNHAYEPRARSMETSPPILTAAVLTALGVLVAASITTISPVAVILAAATIAFATLPLARRQVELRRLLVAQRAVVAQLEELDRAKSEMMATLNHEIRTPLTSIRGYLELVIQGEGGTIPLEAGDLLRVAEHNADRLAALVDNMLTMSRLDAGATTPERQQVDLGALLYRVVASLQPFATSRRVALDVDELGISPRVLGDETQLERAFTNVTQNALKFTPAGGSVGIEVAREVDTIVVRVIDTGMGIPEKEMSMLFGRFYRASNAQRGAIPGSGLGLAIVRSLVRAHNGDVSISSAVDVGTTVRVELPAAD